MNINIIDVERQNILNRIKEIKTTHANRMEIVEGTPVSRELIPEYKNLNRMLEILDHNLEQDGINEYISRRNQTQLSPLPPEEVSTFSNPMNQRLVERDLIKERMKEIASVPKDSSNAVRSNDGTLIRNDPRLVEEYNILDELKTTINRNFKVDSYFDYFNKRNRTNLAPISLGKYQALVGRPAPANEKPDFIDNVVRTQVSASAGTSYEAQESSNMSGASQSETTGTPEPVVTSEVPKGSDGPQVKERESASGTFEPLTQEKMEATNGFMASRGQAAPQQEVATAPVAEPPKDSHPTTPTVPQQAEPVSKGVAQEEIEALLTPPSRTAPSFRDDNGRLFDAYAVLGLEKSTATKERVEQAYELRRDAYSQTDNSYGWNMNMLEAAHNILTEYKEEYDREYDNVPAMVRNGGVPKDFVTFHGQVQSDSTSYEEETAAPVVNSVSNEEARLNAISEERVAIQSRKNEIRSLYAISEGSVESVSTRDLNIIKREHQPEYEILLRMEDILNDGLDEDTIQQYVNLRTQTKLGSLDIGLIDVLGRTKEIPAVSVQSTVQEREANILSTGASIPETHEEPVVNTRNEIPVLTSRDLMFNALKEEHALIKGRKKEISQYFTQGKSKEELESPIHSKIISGNFQTEYEILLKMETLLNLGLKETNIQEYSRLRAQSPLGRLDADRIDILLGKAEIKQEEGLTIGASSEVNSKKTYSISYDSLYKDQGYGLDSLNFGDSHYSQSSPQKVETELKQEPMYKDIPQTEMSLVVPETPAKKTIDSLDQPIEASYREVGAGSSVSSVGDEGAKKDESEQVLDTDEYFEVVKTSPWHWVKDHKKQILISLGLSALAIAAWVGLKDLSIAEKAAKQASDVAGMVAQMLKNSSLHPFAIASEKSALHAANVGLGNTIEATSKYKVVYDTTTHAWSFIANGVSKNLSQSFVDSSAAAAAEAAAKVSSLTKAALGWTLGGLGTIGLAHWLPNKKSEEFHDIKNEIYDLIDNAHEMTLEEQTQMAKNINNIILSSDKLSDEESIVLFRKLRKAIAKAKKRAIEDLEPTKDIDTRKVSEALAEEDLTSVAAKL